VLKLPSAGLKCTPAGIISIPAMEHTAIAPAVQATLSYMVPMGERPVSYMYAPPPGVPELNARYASRHAVIRDMRPLAAELSLERQGFQLLAHQSSAVAQEAPTAACALGARDGGVRRPSSAVSRP